MKLNKKYLGMTALLSATAMATVLSASAADVVSTATPTTKFGNRGHHTETQAERQAHQLSMATALANALGTTPEAITAQITAGKTPQDIIKASGIDEATIKAQLEASREADMKTRLAADVTSGKLTQAQADEMITNMANHKGGPGHFGGTKRTNTPTASAQ